MEKPIDLLRGCVTVEVEGVFPERLLNLCAKKGLPFWNASPVRDYRMRLTVYCRDREALGVMAERAQCRILSQREKGMPKAARPMKRRYAFLAGIVFCLLLLFWSSLFIWDFEVTGNAAVSDSEILAALDDCGVGIGSFWPWFSSDLIRCRVLLRIPELSWLAVNVHGSNAQVIVREGVPKPEIRDETTPTDVVAEKAGIITEIRVYRGEKLTVAGETAAQGDLLVSGAVGSILADTRFVHASADIYARTWYDTSAVCALTRAEKSYTGEKTTRFALIIGESRINFYGNSGISGTGCDKIIEEYPLAIKGVFTLPLTLVKETCYEYGTAPAAADRAALRAGLEALLISTLTREIGEDGEIVSSYFSAAEKNGYLIVTLHAECLENIAREVPMSDLRVQEIKAAEAAEAGEADG